LKDLKARRLAMGLTQAELSRRIGYSGSYNSHVERGDYTFPDTIKPLVEKVLNGESVNVPVVARRKYTAKGAIPSMPFENKAEKAFFRELWAKRYGGE